MLNEQLIPTLVLFSEIGIILAVVAIVAVFIYVRKTRRLREMSLDLASQFKQQINPRKEEIETLLNEVYSMDAQTASEEMNKLFQKEKSTYARILKSVFGEDKDHALFIYKDIKGLINYYHMLPLTYAINAAVIEKNSTDMVKKSELEKLQSKLDALTQEHEAVTQELSDTKDLLERTQREYRSMYPAIYGEAEPGAVLPELAIPENQDAPSTAPVQSFQIMDPLEGESDNGDEALDPAATLVSQEEAQATADYAPNGDPEVAADETQVELDESKVPTLMDNVEPAAMLASDNVSAAEADGASSNAVTEAALDSIPVLDDMVVPQADESLQTAETSQDSVTAELDAEQYDIETEEDSLSQASEASAVDELSLDDIDLESSSDVESIADSDPVTTSEAVATADASKKEKTASDENQVNSDEKREKLEIESLLDGLDDFGDDDLDSMAEEVGATDSQTDTVKNASSK